MSEQDGTQATARRGSRQTSKQNGTQEPTLQHPANDDKEAWIAYWKAQGQPWRTEPEIDIECQRVLDERRSITPDIEQGIYPFKDIEPKLTRADVEWLLATHENGCGPVDWSDEGQRGREGLDMRGVDLREVDLSRLPLAKLRCGVTYQEIMITTRKQRLKAVAHLEHADLSHAHLEGATFRNGYLGYRYVSCHQPQSN